MTNINELIAEAFTIATMGAHVAEATDIGTHAIEYAIRNWEIFPLRGKVPAIPSREGGRGVLDGTCDLTTVLGWWSGRYAGCNSGGRPPASMFVLDIDPRNGGQDALDELQAEYG